MSGTTPFQQPTTGLQGGCETVLVAEDDRMVRKLLIRSLEIRGYHVLAAGNPREALRLSAEHDGPIDLVLTDLARKHKVATQMGNQGHSNPDSRRYVELIQAGVLGDVKEVHIWTDRPIWPQGIGRPSGSPPVPKNVNWDLWLGPAPERPYHPAYHPFKWRGFWDFGTGAVGDMGCHNSDLAYWALNLRDPETLEAVSSGINDETAPKWSIITYHFPKLGKRKAVKVTWYDGGKKPEDRKSTRLNSSHALISYAVFCLKKKKKNKKTQKKKKKIK